MQQIPELVQNCGISVVFFFTFCENGKYHFQERYGRALTFYENYNQTQWYLIPPSHIFMKTYEYYQGNYIFTDGKKYQGNFRILV